MCIRDRILYVLVGFLGAIGVGDVVWTVSDICNALMAVPNIIMVLLLSGMIARETKHYVCLLYTSSLTGRMCPWSRLLKKTLTLGKWKAASRKERSACKSCSP